MRAGLEGSGLIANSMGFTSFFLLWLATVWGIVLRNGWASTRIRHSTAASIHTTVALLGLCLALIHALALWAALDRAIRLVDVFVPFASSLVPRGGIADRYYTDLDSTPVDRLGVSLGVIAFEFLVAIAASVLIQRRIGYHRWRVLHSLTYPAFLLTVSHILITGVGYGVAWILVSACCLITIVLWLGAPLWTAIGDSRLGRAMSMGRGGQAMMTVGVDSRRCERAGFCVQAAPKVFQMHGDGRLSYQASVTATDVEAVIRAAETCPVQAIVLGLAASSVTTQSIRVNGGSGAPRSRRATGMDRYQGSR